MAIFFYYCNRNSGIVTLVLSIGYFLYTGSLGNRSLEQLLFFIQCFQYIVWKLMNQVTDLIAAVKL
jgi:hypothetical protein